MGRSNKQAVADGPRGAVALARRRVAPKYAPELNDIEVVWRDLKAHHLAHQTFTGAVTLDEAIHNAVHDVNGSSVGQIANLRLVNTTKRQKKTPSKGVQVRGRKGAGRR